MNFPLSPWPRRVALAYMGLVVLTWVLALSSGPFSDRMQTWPIIVALPWSLILFLDGPAAALFGIFLAGLMNGGLLYLLLRSWARRSTARHRPLLLPPAA